MWSSRRNAPASPANTPAPTTSNLALALRPERLPSRGAARIEDETLAAIAEQVWVSTRADGAAIAVEEDGEIVCRASAGSCAPSVGAVLRRGSGISGYCLRTGRIVLCRDTERDERVDPAVARTLGIRSVIALPVRSYGRVVGLVEVLAREPNHFGEDEEGTLHVAAVAISRLLDKDFASASSDFLSTAPPATDPAEEPESEVPEQAGENNFEVASEAATEAPEPAPEPDTELSAETHEEATEAPAQESPAPAEAAAAAETEPIFSFAETAAVDVPASRFLVVLVASMVVVAAVILGLSLRTRMTKTPSEAAPQLAALLSRVNSGDVHAELELAHFYQRKDTVAHDPAAALQWLRRAAGEGEPIAQYELAMRYLNGEGVERGEAEAISWLLKSAHLGNNGAQYELGVAYENGSGVPQDLVKAYACYVMARVNGNAEADAAQKKIAGKMTRQQIADSRTLLGEMYAGGIGTPVDKVQSYVWFSLAQAAGSREGRENKALLAAKMSKEEIAAAAERASELLNGPEQR